jgi:hypothetical protein
MKIPFVRASTMLPTYYQADVPPMWSDALPGELSRWELDVEWMCHDALLWRQPWIRRDNPIDRSDFYKFVEQCGVSVAQINFRDAFNYYVESDPQLVMCSKAFDFPRADIPDRVYAGASLAEVDAEPWTYAARRPDAPLIYCAFGSMGLSYPAVNSVIERLLDMARVRPGLDIVIAVPDDAMKAYEIPPTVHALRWAPQRQVLREADVFITHAGLASCRESIWEGVPMLAIPLAHDQRGLAARIVYHELGERLVGEIPSTAVFVEAIDRLLTDPKYKQAAERMRAEFRTGKDDTIGLRFVTDVMEGRIKPKTSAYYEKISRRLYLSIMGED